MIAILVEFVAGCSHQKDGEAQGLASVNQVDSILSLVVKDFEAGNVADADRKLEELFRIGMTPSDSVRAATMYVGILLELEQYSRAQEYIDIAFNTENKDPNMLMRRYSYLFQIYIINGDCNNALNILDKQDSLLLWHDDLALTSDDIMYNRGVVQRRCGFEVD